MSAAIPGRRTILLVDDAEADIEFTRSALASLDLPHVVVSCRDGVEALDFLLRRGSFADRPPGLPALILLDLKMPRVDGFDVLRRVKSDAALAAVPVVMLTSSRDAGDIAQSYRLGANGYVVKPMDFDDFLAALRKVGDYWARVNEPPDEATSGQV